MSSQRTPTRLILMPVSGPIAVLADGVPVDLEHNTRFLVSRFPRVKDAPAEAEVGEFEGVPCLFLQDRYLSYPNAEICREGDIVRIRLAHDRVRNPLFVNQPVPRPDAGVTESELAVGDTVQIGLSKFRVERAAMTGWAGLFSKAYPDLAWISLIDESEADHRTIHHCQSKEGYRVDVECKAFPGPVAEHFRRSEETVRRLIALRDHLEADKLLKPWLPRIYDVRSVEDGHGTYIFIAREPVTAPTLDELVVVPGEPMPLQTAVRFGARLCEAVHRFHNFGLHRALTPDAVYWQRGDDPSTDRVLLGGLFHTKDSTGGATLTDQPPDLTTIFRPPEHLDHGEYTERSDMYAVALLIGVALTGKLPYDSRTVMGLVQQVMYAQPPLPDDVSAKLKAVLQRGWAKRPNQRFRSMLDLKVQLQRLLETGVAP